MSHVYLLKKNHCNYTIRSDNDDYLDVIASVYTDNAEQWAKELRTIFDSKFTTKFNNDDYDIKYHDEMIKTFCKYASRRMSVENPSSY
jgi:hypothetical protein